MFRDTLPSFLLASLLAAIAGQPTGAQEGGGPGVDAPASPGAVEPIGALPGHWFGQGPRHKVMLTRAELAALPVGALVRSTDYGAFVHAVVDETAWGGAAGLLASGLDVRDEQDLIVLNDIVIDGTQPELALRALDPAQLFTDPDTMQLPYDAGLYIVQFDGPVRDEWLDALTATGARVVHYVPMNAYVVAAGPSAAAALQSLDARETFVQFVGAYEAPFRLHPALRAAQAAFVNEALPVTIQLINGDGVRAVIAEIASMADSVQSSNVVGPYVNVRAVLHPVFFTTIALNPRVFNVELAGELVRHDEAQGQIIAGNVSGASPTGPGYLAWLAAMGFTSSQFGSFAVNVVDDATSLTGHPDLATGRVAFTQNPSGQSGTQGGHGFLNAHIVAGLNSGTGSAVEDASGYNYGLGIAPWARVGSTAIFGPSGTSASSFESSAYNAGSRISTNSWGFSIGGSPIADYDSNSQEYDFLTRDVQSGVGGNQQYLVLFAAGNDGPGSNTVSTPGTAKNIVTVGASENFRQTGTDGCGVSNSGANNLNDIISFSSRGPVNSTGGDGRWKPEVVAPGTHIEAGVPQSSYSGASVCNAFWPTGQTLYGWSSGTSHSTPAVAGGAALVYQWFQNNGLGTPTPAMVKAVLVNSAEYMNGVGANDTLPSNSQGMGLMDLGRAFTGPAAIRVDQTQILGSSGATHVVTGNVVDGGQPFRVSLVWTDAPGPTSGAPWVNNLDLTVTVGGQTYRGNVFSGANSTTGGSSDIRNNTESVFLPAGTTGAFTVTVTAASIAGDGVPGNADATDQDFALLIANGTAGAAPPTANFVGTPTSGVAPLNVAFTDASSGSITSRLWTFGDGATSTATNPNHTYASAGSYTVTLSVTGATGSDDEVKANYITASAPPTPGVSDGSFEAQSAGSTPVSPWTVTFGTGHVINPTSVSSDNGMPSDGTKWAELSAASTNGATPPSNPGGVGTPAVGTAGIAQTFSYTSGATVLSFDAAFLRNESASSSFNDFMSVDVTDGSTNVNLYYADTFTATSGTSAKYGYAMTAVANVTADLAVLFPSSTTSTSFTVTAGVGNGSDGVQPSLGYVDNFALGGSTPAPPTAGFTGSPTSGTAPLNVSFTDTSTGSITSWAWTFGDGGTSSAANPSHTYTAAGTYSVALTVTGPGGNDTLTRTNYISVGSAPTAPTAGFSATPTSGTAPLNVSFTDTSTGSITSWAWTFGDGGTSSAQSPSHTYTSAGTYTVSLTVTGPGGNDTLTQPNLITVSNPPVGGSLYYLSFTTNTVVPGVGTVTDDDIVSYDPGTGAWALYFDGSDVGLAGTDINALHVRPNGSIIMSFNSSSFSVPGLTGGPSGTTVEDSDLVLFTPTSTGSTTAGSFSFLLDGSDIGLTTSNEDIDAVYETAGGDLRISTLGSFSVSGASGVDEDIVQLSNVTTGASSGGTWSLYFDGSDVGFNTSSSEDIDAISFQANGDLVFSTVGLYSAAGGAGDNEDVSAFSGTFGSATSGTAALLLDLSALGIDVTEDVDGLSFQP